MTKKVPFPFDVQEINTVVKSICLSYFSRDEACLIASHVLVLRVLSSFVKLDKGCKLVSVNSL